jgi:hypothetical protein
MLSIISDLDQSFFEKPPGILVLADELDRGVLVGAAGGRVDEVVAEFMNVGQLIKRVEVPL